MFNLHDKEKLIVTLISVETGCTIDEVSFNGEYDPDGYDLCYTVEDRYWDNSYMSDIVNRTNNTTSWASATRSRDSILYLDEYTLQCHE